jgi:hypothetical protein
MTRVSCCRKPGGYNCHPQTIGGCKPCTCPAQVSQFENHTLFFYCQELYYIAVRMCAFHLLASFTRSFHADCPYTVKILHKTHIHDKMKYHLQPKWVPKLIRSPSISCPREDVRSLRKEVLFYRGGRSKIWTEPDHFYSLLTSLVVAGITSLALLLRVTEKASRKVSEVLPFKYCSWRQFLCCWNHTF